MIIIHIIIVTKTLCTAQHRRAVDAAGTARGLGAI